MFICGSQEMCSMDNMKGSKTNLDSIELSVKSKVNPFLKGDSTEPKKWTKGSSLKQVGLHQQNYCYLLICKRLRSFNTYLLTVILDTTPPGGFNNWVGSTKLPYNGLKQNDYSFFIRSMTLLIDNSTWAQPNSL